MVIENDCGGWQRICTKYLREEERCRHFNDDGPGASRDSARISQRPALTLLPYLRDLFHSILYLYHPLHYAALFPSHHRLDR
jgi:hypothetical protein